MQLFLGTEFPKGKLPNVTDLWSIPDFEFAARNFLNDTAYAWIRYGTGAEYTYKNNLEIFPRVGFKPRVLTGSSTNVNMSMHTTILGHHFDAPIFISPAAAPGLVGGYVPEHEELGLVQGAGNEGILYIPALYAEMRIEQMGKAQLPGQTMFQQLYAQHNRTFNKDILTRAEKAGKKAIVWTVDAPADGAWVYGARFTLPPRSTTTLFSWDFYDELRNMTSLPVIPKGITSVEDAKIAVAKGAPAIILSNHGGRHLDGAPSPFQTALRIHDAAPEIFKQTEVLADCGVRYGGDILKFLAARCQGCRLGKVLHVRKYLWHAGCGESHTVVEEGAFLGRGEPWYYGFRPIEFFLGKSTWTIHLVLE